MGSLLKTVLVFALIYFLVRKLSAYMRSEPPERKRRPAGNAAEKDISDQARIIEDDEEESTR